MLFFIFSAGNHCFPVVWKALNIYLPSALIGFLCLLLSFPMGMKADWEFNAKCKLPCIPMYCSTTRDTRLLLWHGVCYEHTATKACLQQQWKQKAQLGNLNKVRKEQNSPPPVRKNGEGRHFEIHTKIWVSVLREFYSFKVKTGLLWYVKKIITGTSLWIIIKYFLPNAWVCLGLAVVWVRPPVQVRSDCSSATRLLEEGERLGAEGVKVLGGHRLYWLFIINTA